MTQTDTKSSCSREPERDNSLHGPTSVDRLTCPPGPAWHNKVLTINQGKSPAAKPIQVEDNRTGTRATDCLVFILSQIRFASSTGYPARIIMR